MQISLLVTAQLYELHQQSNTSASPLNHVSMHRTMEKQQSSSIIFNPAAFIQSYPLLITSSKHFKASTTKASRALTSIEQNEPDIYEETANDRKSLNLVISSPNIGCVLQLKRDQLGIGSITSGNTHNLHMSQTPPFIPSHKLTHTQSNLLVRPDLHHYNQYYQINEKCQVYLYILSILVISSLLAIYITIPFTDSITSCYLRLGIVLYSIAGAYSQNCMTLYQHSETDFINNNCSF